jgi:hypothetical protein
MTFKAYREHYARQRRKRLGRLGILFLLLVSGFAAALAFLHWLDPHCNLASLSH